MNPQVQTTLILIVVAFLLLGGAQGSRQVPASSADVTLLARLIDAEAGGEPYRGKVAVGAVVVNRMKDDRYPNTLREVIYQPGQFAVNAMSTIRTPSDESVRAAEAALRGEDPTRGALFFYNPKTARLDPWWNSRRALIQIGNHLFLR